MQTTDSLIDSIRAAVAPDASLERKRVGADACRRILASLEAAQGAPLAPPPRPSPLAMIAAMPREQLVDFVIARLQAFVDSRTKALPEASK